MFIFSEDPPLKDKGYGLSVLLYNLFCNSLLSITTWFTFIPNISITKKDIKSVSGINFRIVEYDSLKKLFSRSPRLNLIYNQIVFFGVFPELILRVRKNKTYPIFIPVGASPLLLYKIRLIQIFTANPVYLYLVDDLEEIANKQNRKIDKLLCKFFLEKTLKKSDKIFAITPVLANKLSLLSSKTVTVILPCFERIAPIVKESSKAKKITFVFTGGLSFLYNNSLKLFSTYLTQFQNEFGIDCRIIVQTYTSKEDFDKIGFTEKNIEYRTSESRSALYKTYSEADAFIVPYSFDSNERNIVSTSFPQKIAQIIQFGIPIVVFGPAYGSVVQFFSDRKLDFVIDSIDFLLFKERILKLLDVNLDDIHKNYIAVYERNFLPDICLGPLINIE